MKAKQLLEVQCIVAQFTEFWTASARFLSVGGKRPRRAVAPKRRYGRAGGSVALHERKREAGVTGLSFRIRSAGTADPTNALRLRPDGDGDEVAPVAVGGAFVPETEPVLADFGRAGPTASASLCTWPGSRRRLRLALA